MRKLLRLFAVLLVLGVIAAGRRWPGGAIVGCRRPSRR